MITVKSRVGKFGAVLVCETCKNDFEAKNLYSAQKSPLGGICNPCKSAISELGELTRENLNAAFTYEPHTGALRFKRSTRSGLAGNLCTFNHIRGYLSVSICGKQYLAHRIIYMMVEGYWPNHIDHINHDKQDNRWENLRSITQSVNNKNMPLQQNNRTGFTGVSYCQKRNKYIASITVKSKWTYLGIFADFEDAKAAREAANALHGYHSNHGK